MTLTRPYIWIGLAVVAAPAFAWLVYRLAQGLGFLEPPTDRQHELRRTIVLAIYSFLLFLPVLIYGFEERWPGAVAKAGEAGSGRSRHELRRARPGPRAHGPRALRRSGCGR